MTVAFCLEQTLGHRAHSANLEAALGRSSLASVVVRIDPPESPVLPWALAASWRAHVNLKATAPRAAVRFFHTQSLALLAPLMRNGSPFVVSVDATPIQMDRIGRWYGHQEGNRLAEKAKRSLYRSVFARAAGMVAWSEWAAASLSNDYGVAADRILVAHPGAPPEFFNIPDRTPVPGAKPTVLFVGGDLERKGADLLIRAHDAVKAQLNLIIVTSAPIEPPDGVEVIRNARPGSPELLDAYRRSDFFCLPTRGDCTPVVLGEAMASGLPVVTTRVGSNEETVTDGEDGILLDIDDVAALRAALLRLAGDPAERRRLACAARSTARARLDADRNAAKIFRMLEALA